MTRTIILWKQKEEQTTYHTVIGKDLDIIHRTAQVLGNLPPDTSYCLITVGLHSTNTHKHSEVIFSVDVTLHDKGR